MLDQLTQLVSASQSLTEAQVRDAVNRLVDETIPAVAKADFLTALAGKGETPEEIAAFARELRERAVTPPIDPAWRGAREILDVVGTGGDHLSTFNISTTVALIAAAAGVAVAKHGNRAVTSNVGSADVMEALGVPFDLGPEDAAHALREHGFAFFFAPKYHPAFKHIGPARKLCAERGQRTVFNFLGPLLNPARPSAALIGVPRPELCEPLARVLQSLGMRRAMVVCGTVPIAVADSSPGLKPAATTAHLDELSTLGDNTVAEFYRNNDLPPPGSIPPNPVAARSPRRSAWWRPQVNADFIRRVLAAAMRGPKRTRAVKCRRGVVRGRRRAVRGGRLGTGGGGD